MTVEIEIDGKKLLANPNSMVIQVADEAGIYIPRFCYHKHLSIAANCRMCLVEVEKSPKTLPACATPVTAGMKVFTRSPKAIAAQKAVMEFLLINHPLDCPICDQGGECELQDLSMGYGGAESYFSEGKRSVKDLDIGPLIETAMTRCIQCTRCVRFGDEIAGVRELGATGRGEDMEIGTYVQKAVSSEVSGNIIDICPVGALVSKPFLYTARAWELDQYPTIAAHDCIGANIYAHTRYGKVMRVVPHENISINETWISDRDRFSYEGLYHADRINKPRIRRNDEWEEVDWQTALEFAVSGIQGVLTTMGADYLGALASPNSTVEEFYLLQKLLRGLGSANIDHRLRQVDFSDQMQMPAFPGLGMPIAELQNCDVIFLIGSNIQKEQPSASLRVRKAALKNAKILSLNMLDYPFHFHVAEKCVVSPGDFVATLVKIAKALAMSAPPGLQTLFDKVQTDAVHGAMANYLRTGKKSCLLLGALAFNHPQASLIRALAQAIAKASGAQLGFLTEGANAAGAWLAGAVPHRAPAAAATRLGLNAEEMFKASRKAYILLNVDPDLDCANPIAASQALEQAEFVISLSPFRNALLDQYADVILPIAPFTETSGTFVNAAGQWQGFKGVASAFGESRPAWKVLRVLGNLFSLPNFEYESSEEVLNEIKLLIDKMPTLSPDFKISYGEISLEAATQFTRVGEIPLYALDSLVRRAKSLQKMQNIVEGELASVRMHPEVAKKLAYDEGMKVRIKQHEYSVELPIVFDKRVPEHAVLIAGGIEATRGLMELFGAVEIKNIL